MLQAYTELSKTWYRFLVKYVLNNSVMDIVSSVKRLGFSFELRPSEGNSYHVPKEWRSGASKDLVAIEVSGNVNRMIDTFVHELGHVEFTPRDKLYKKLLGKYRYICNLVEDVRVEHLIRQKYGWTFKTWTYPRISYLERFHGRNLIALMIWLYVKKIANSRGEEVPREYAQFVVARAGVGAVQWVEEVYQEVISIRNSSDMKAFLENYFFWDRTGNKFVNRVAKKLLAAKGYGRRVKMSGGGSDLAKGKKEIQRIEEETKKLEEELKKVLEERVSLQDAVPKTLGLSQGAPRRRM